MSEIRMKTIAVDFDGVIHRYSEGWKDGAIYDAPIKGAKEAIEELSKHYEVVVFTARDNLDDVKTWLKLHSIIVSDVTNKKPIASFYIDDRAVEFKGSWDETLALVQERRCSK